MLTYVWVTLGVLVVAVLLIVIEMLHMDKVTSKEQSETQRWIEREKSAVVDTLNRQAVGVARATRDAGDAIKKEAELRELVEEVRKRLMELDDVVQEQADRISEANRHLDALEERNAGAGDEGDDGDLRGSDAAGGIPDGAGSEGEGIPF